MRLFVAAPLPVPARAAVASVCDALRDALPPARWLPAEQWHVTLQFLGESEPSCVEPLTTGLRSSLAEVPSFETELGGGGCYPLGREARVAWVGFADPAGWPFLAAAVRRATQALGYRTEERPVSPHVTIARPRPAWSRGVAAQWRGGLPVRIGAPFVVSTAALYHSDLGPGGARHQVLAELPLGGGC